MSNKQISPSHWGQILEAAPLMFQKINTKQTLKHFGWKTDCCWLILQLSFEQATCLIESIQLTKLVHM